MASVARTFKQKALQCYTLFVDLSVAMTKTVARRSHSFPYQAQWAPPPLLPVSEQRVSYENFKYSYLKNGPPLLEMAETKIMRNELRKKQQQLRKLQKLTSIDWKCMRHPCPSYSPEISQRGDSEYR